MESRLSRYCEGVMEAAWLLAAIITPLYFNVYAAQVFEPGKLVWVRSLALVALAAWLVRAVGGATALPPRAGLAGLLRQPLLLAVAAVVLSQLLSTVLSIAPRLSLAGSLERLEGTTSTLAYVALFAVIVTHLRRRAQVERVLTAIVVTSLPVALYGLAQQHGLDPLPWGHDTLVRLNSTLGNAIFVAAYLGMVAPLALGRMLLALDAARAARHGRAVHVTRAALYLFILGADLLAIVGSGSRGPLLGLAAGGTLFLVLSAAAARARRLAWCGIVLTAAAAGLLIVLNLPQRPLAGLERRFPTVERLGHVLDSEVGTGRVRVLLWGTVRRMMASDEPQRFPPEGRPDAWHAIRPLVGYGPETLRLTADRFYDPELARYEYRAAAPDRSHNELWDALASTGLLGLLARLALWGVLFACGLAWLGIGSRAQAATAIALGGALGGIGLALARGVELAGVGVPAGMLAGVLGLAARRAVGRQHQAPRVPSESWRALALCGLLAALASHLVEGAFGIGVAATCTLFWTLLALLLVLGERRVEAASVPAPEPQRQTVWTSAGLVASLLLVLGFDFITNPARATDPLRVVLGALAPWAVLGIVVTTWLCGGVLATLEDDLAAARPSTRRRLGLVLGMSLAAEAGGVLVLGVRLAALSARRPATLDGIVDAVRGVAGLAAVELVLVAAFGGAWALTLGRGALPGARSKAAPRRPLAWRAAAIVLAGVAVSLGAAANLRIVEADVLAKAGLEAGARAQLELGTRLLERAVALAPRQDAYRLQAGLVAQGAAVAARDPAEREAQFARAQEAFEHAARQNPLFADHWTSLARLRREWGLAADEPTARAVHFAAADRAYATAAELSPNRASLWNEWAAFQLRQTEDLPGAQAKLERSLALDPDFKETQRLEAELSRARGAEPPGPSD